MRTLVELDKCAMIDGENVYLDSYTLVSRLFVLLEGCEDVILFFTFKLTTFQTSNFKNFQMRKPCRKKNLIPDVPEYQLVTDSVF